jgi:hypothetical protein
MPNGSAFWRIPRLFSAALSETVYRAVRSRLRSRMRATLVYSSASFADLLNSLACWYLRMALFAFMPSLISLALTCVEHDKIQVSNTYCVILSFTASMSRELITSLLSSASLRASSNRLQPRFTWPDGKRSVRKLSSVHVKTPDASSVREGELEIEEADIS